MRMIGKTWKNVSRNKIINCFKKSEFSVPTQVDPQDEGGHLDDVTIEAEWKIVTNHYQTEELTFEEFINFDGDVAVTGTLSESDIIALLNHNKNKENSNDDIDDIDDSRDSESSTKET